VVCLLLFCSGFGSDYLCECLMIIVKKGVDISKVDFKAGAVILIDKPLEWTSFDVVNKLRFALRRKYDLKKFKVGHNGTLDPLATGLLMIFTGKYTKRIPNEENHDKRYTGQVKLGATTETLDREKEETDIRDASHINQDMVSEAMGFFQGEIEQELPRYSAAKVGGVRMYKLARKEKEVPKKFKKVVFHSSDLISFENPYVSFVILCGKGTYIRSFARDLGRRLDTSAYLYALRRTEIANYHVNDAMNVQEVFDQINPE